MGEQSVANISWSVDQEQFFLKKWAIHGLFLIIFCSFQTIDRIKTVDFSGIRTRIVGVEGEHADHLTTTALPRTVWLHFKNRIFYKNLILDSLITFHMIGFSKEFLLNKNVALARQLFS